MGLVEVVCATGILAVSLHFLQEQAQNDTVCFLREKGYICIEWGEGKELPESLAFGGVLIGHQHIP
jgi:hypothetical protein